MPLRGNRAVGTSTRKRLVLRALGLLGPQAQNRPGGNRRRAELKAGAPDHGRACAPMILSARAVVYMGCGPLLCMYPSSDS